MGVAVRAEAVGHVKKQRLKQRFENLGSRQLQGLVHDGRYAQWPHRAVCFGDEYSAHRLRAVRMSFQICDSLSQGGSNLCGRVALFRPPVYARSLVVLEFDKTFAQVFDVQEVHE